MEIARRLRPERTAAIRLFRLVLSPWVASPPSELRLLNAFHNKLTLPARRRKDHAVVIEVALGFTLRAFEFAKVKSAQAEAYATKTMTRLIYRYEVVNFGRLCGVARHAGQVDDKGCDFERHFLAFGNRANGLAF